MWLICLPEADAGGQITAVVGAALSHGLKAAGVAAAAIGERVGGVVVERDSNMEPVVCVALQKTGYKLMMLYNAVALVGLAKDYYDIVKLISISLHIEIRLLQ